MITVSNIDSRGVGRMCNKFFLMACAIGVAEKGNDKVVLPKWKYRDVFKYPLETDHLALSKVRVTYNELQFNYDEIEYHNNMELRGYFQSEKYFKHAEAEVRKRFTPNDDIRHKIFDNFPELYEVNNPIISVHVRRGDYKFIQNHHPLCTMDYYNEAMNMFPEDAIFIVTTEPEDMHWCKEHFID